MRVTCWRNRSPLHDVGGIYNTLTRSQNFVVEELGDIVSGFRGCPQNVGPALIYIDFVLIMAFETGKSSNISHSLIGITSHFISHFDPHTVYCVQTLCGKFHSIRTTSEPTDS